MSDHYRSILNVLSPSFVNEFSMSLDGIDEYFNGGSTFSELDGQTKVSISAWIKSGTLTSSSYLFAIGGASSLFQIAVRLQSTSVTNANCWLYIGGASNSERSFASLGAIKNDGQWHHLMLCLDLSLPNYQECQIFLDGIALTMSGYYNPTSLQNASTSLIIGNRENPNTGLYVGSIDEFAMWVGTDQRANVSDIYNGGVPFDLSTLATAPSHWWRMGDNDTWNGSQWTLSDNIGSYDLNSVNMEEADRVTDVP